MGERAARKLAVSRREKPPGLGRWDWGWAAQGKRSPLLNMEAVKPIMLNRAADNNVRRSVILV